MKLRVGGKVTSKDTHTIEITLAPPEDRATCQVRGGDVEDVLVDAIATVRAVVTEAAAGDDPWVLTASTINIRFAITQTGTISLGVDANWRTRSRRPCALDWRQALHEHDPRYRHGLSAPKH